MVNYTCTFTFTLAPNVGGHSARNSSDSAVGIDISLRAGRSGRGQIRFSSPKRSNRLCSPPGPTFSRYRRFFPPRDKAAGGREFDHSPQSNTEGLRMSGAVSLLPVYTFKLWTEEFTFPFRHVRRIAKSCY